MVLPSNTINHMELSTGPTQRLPTTIVVGKLSISQTIQDELTKALKKDLGSRTLAETTKMLNKFVKDLNGNTITEDKVDAMHAFSADVRIKLREIANTEKARALTDEAVLPDDVKIVSSYAGVLSTFSTLDRGSVHELIRRDAIRRHEDDPATREHMLDLFATLLQTAYRWEPELSPEEHRNILEAIVGVGSNSKIKRAAQQLWERLAI